MALVAFVGSALWVWLPNLPFPKIFERWGDEAGAWEAWGPLYQGIDYARAFYDYPRPMKVHAIRVDLSHPGVSMKVLRQPSSEVEGMVETTYMRRLMEQHGVQVAFHGNLFHPPETRVGKPVRVKGLAVSEGHRWSEATPEGHSCIVSRENKVRLVGPGGEVGDAWEAFSGPTLILRDGGNRGGTVSSDGGATCGLSSDGRYFFCLVVDGSQPGYSEGVTSREAAEMMLELGASDAIHMGGDSGVGLAVDSKFGHRSILNRPANRFINGVQCPTAMVVGIRALPLE